MASELKLTRYVHSCVLAEFADQTVLIDPGQFSYESGLFDVDKISRIDKIVITHEHADHFYQPFVEEVMQKFPMAIVVMTQPVHDQLGNTSEDHFAHTSEQDCQVFKPPHARLAFSDGPANIGVHLFGLLTVPGDSHNFNETKPVLAMPMTAPWGSMVSAIDKILELKPKVVLPVHDWHWRTEALEGMYQSFRSTLAGQGIDFIIPTDGQQVQISL